MLWNLGFLEEEEKCNSDYKQLVDNLRTFSLYPYLISKDYHYKAVQELAKVDWERQPDNTRRWYHQPLAWLRVKYSLEKLGSMVKHMLMR